MFSASKSAAVSSGYQIPKSLRFRSSASAYLNRTPSVAGNRQTWTWSGWVKRGKLDSSSVTYPLMTSYVDTSNYSVIDFRFNTLRVLNGTTATGEQGKITTQVFRDTSAWYHIVVSVNNPSSTLNVYVNGVQVTSFSTNTTVTGNWLFNSTNAQRIGYEQYSTLNEYFDGYMAEVNFIDGQALTPSSFGAFDATSGVWQPTRYSGTYGTNGFYLKFSNTTSTTTLCYDYSGNSNNWTPNNISLTAGSTYDSMLDSPTNYDNGGNGVGNYAVLNPLNIGSASSLNSGNLNYNATSSSGSIFQSQITASFSITSGKYYWEVTPSLTSASGIALGVAKSTKSMTANPFTSGVAGEIYVYIGVNGYKHDGVTSSVYGATYTTNDVIGVAFDMDAGTITFYKNNTSQGTAFSSISGSYMPFLVCSGSGETNAGSFNFGQRPFSYTPPTGYKALNTQNLPAPSIQNGANYMAATTYTGNGTSQSISNANNGVSFQPDFVWVKSRSNVSQNELVDSVRGANGAVMRTLFSNQTVAEQSLNTDTDLTFGLISSLNSNGFTVNTGATNAGQTNFSGYTYVGWQWKAGGTAVTNTAGSITSSVSANTTAGFSVVTYTGTGANATVGHGLGVAPSMVIIKARASANLWVVYHASLGASGYISLNSTAAFAFLSTAFNNTTPTSSVFSIGVASGTNDTNGSMVAYCFAAIPGYSAFGSYTGNGSADGPFVYCGFRPRWILAKPITAVGEWRLFDTARSPYNAAQGELFPNLNNAENVNAAYNTDILSNGFKPRASSTGTNDSGIAYIYAAFAENPIKYSLAR